MAGLPEFEALLKSVPECERTRILKWAVEALGGAFPGIDSRPDVCGGEPCIIRTRIPVWVLEQARRLGATDQSLLASYPTLRPEDLRNAWAYVSAHPPDIDVQIHRNEAA